MKTMAVTKFKAECLRIVDHLDPEGLTITKHGRPVARLLPIERASAELIGAMAGQIQVNGDIMSTDESWDNSAEP